MALQDNNILLLDAQGFQRTIDPASDTIAVGVDTTFAQDLAVGGNLTVTGDIISGGTMDVVVSDNFIDLSNGQTNGTNKAGGLTVNVQASVARQSLSTAGGAANDAVFSGGNTVSFGVGGYDPDGAGIAAGDIIEIAQATDLAGNNGLFVVLSVTTTSITINGAVQVQSPWAQTAFENGTETAVGASLAPAVDLGVLCISDGALLDIGANAIPVGQFVSAYDTSAKISTIVYEAAANVSLQEAYNVGQQIVMADAQGNMEIRTDDTGARADFRLTNQGATADYLLSAAGLLTVGSGATNKVAMSGQLSTDLIFDGVGPRSIKQTGQDIVVNTLTSGDIDILAANAVQLLANGGSASMTASSNVVINSAAALVANTSVAISASNSGGGTAKVTIAAASAIEGTTSAGGISFAATGGNTILSSAAGDAELNGGNNVSMLAGQAWSATATALDVSLTATAGKVLTTSNGDTDMVVGGIFDLNATSGVEIDAAGAGFSIDSSAGNSNVSADAGSLTVATSTSGDLSLTSADQIIGLASNNASLTSTNAQVNTLAATSSTFSSGGLMSVLSTGAAASVQGQTTLGLTAATGGFTLEGATASTVSTVAGNLGLTGAQDMSAIATAGLATVQGVSLTATASGGAMTIQHQNAGSELIMSSAGTSATEAILVNANAGGLKLRGNDLVDIVAAAGNVEIEASSAVAIDAAAASRFKTTAGSLTIETTGVAESIFLKTNKTSTSQGVQVEGFLNLSVSMGAGYMGLDSGAGVTTGDPLIMSDAGAGPVISVATNATQVGSKIIGVAVFTAAAGTAVHVHTVHGSVFLSQGMTLVAADVGKEVFLGAAGALTLTAPTASGSTVYRVGYLVSAAGMVQFAPQFIAYRP